MCTQSHYATQVARNENQLSIRINKKKPLAIALASLAVIGMGAGLSSAYFTASEPLTVNGSVASFGILVNGAPSNAAPLTIGKIAPGVVAKGTFTVTDTSDTLAGVVYIDQLISLGNVSGGNGLTAADLADLKISIVGSNGYNLPFTAADQLGGAVLDLGGIAKNSTNTYVVSAKLAEDAGNQWIGASVNNAAVQITVKQAH